MTLTGKAKYSFERNFVSSYKKNRNSFFNLSFKNGILDNFYKMPLCLQFGAYVDWFESAGIGIVIFPENKKFSYGIFSDKYTSSSGFNSIAEARIASLVEAEIIYNERIDLDQVLNLVFGK